LEKAPAVGVTIRDVARYASVSTTTVSHVINGTRFVEPETEERVRQAIARLGYRPNLLARSLRRQETHTIGLLVPDNSNPFFAEVARVIEDAGFAKGYSVILCNSDLSDAKQAAYLDVLLSKRVDGVLLVSSVAQQEPLEQVLAAGIPVVVVDRDVPDLPVDQVLVANDEGGFLAGQYLARLGHRRIGCITGISDETPSSGRVIGFRRALAEAGIALPAEAIVRGNERYAGGEEAMAKLLRRDLGLTAVFAFNDVMAIGALTALRRAHVAVPEAISIIGFDNIVQSAAMMPALTTVAQPVAELGQVSIRLLLDRIAQPHEPRSRITLPTQLIERESVRSLTRGG
jgi:DNA-binding LacI/PurR family transcriptional regulator